MPQIIIPYKQHQCTASCCDNRALYTAPIIPMHIDDVEMKVEHPFCHFHHNELIQGRAIFCRINDSGGIYVMYDGIDVCTNENWIDYMWKNFYNEDPWYIMHVHESLKLQRNKYKKEK